MAEGAAMSTKIEWTEETWNPVTGCTKVSPGCANCYAERMAKRLAGRNGYPADEPFRVTLHPDRMDQPLRWKKPRRVFVCSMGDLFHDDVPGEFLALAFDKMRRTPQHTYQVLTKRAVDMWEWCRFDYAPANVWLGVTAEDQRHADERIPLLLQTPAAVRFVSVEPMLEALDLWQYLGCATNPIGPAYGGQGIDWVIIGCESGPNRRPMDLDWAQSLVAQCRAAQVSVFVKQLSIAGRVSYDPAEWPEDLRVREYPEARP